MPDITIVICTRNRPYQLKRALNSITAAVVSNPDVLVIDQSDEVQPIGYWQSTGLRHVPTFSRGLSKARNEALALAQTDIVFFTDDDCLLTPGTVEALTAFFNQEPQLALAFGTVHADEPTSAAGFIPTHYPQAELILRRPISKLRDRGIGACMAVRKEMSLSLGGFDERLGAGGRFPSFEEGEFSYRVLKAGYYVGHLPAARVVHEGLRTWSVGPAYAYHTYRGVGAAYALHARRGDGVATLLLMQQVFSLIARMATNTFRRRPKGFTALRGLISGAAQAMRSTLDGNHGISGSGLAMAHPGLADGSTKQP
jgi:GT2 family glycosyltransferase